MPDLTSPDVGQRIRSIREQRGLSLRALAGLCGLSVNAISLIERGENSPTVSSLHLLATALGVPITDFFKDAHEQAVVRVEPEERFQTRVDGILLESLATGLRNQRVEPFLMHIDPGAGSFEQPVSHSGEEFVYCLQGEVEYCVGGQTYLLRAGSSLLFKATQQHSFRNTNSAPAQLIMIFLADEGAYQLAQQHT